MSECKLDHSIEDVINKYEAQLPMLPQEVVQFFLHFFKEEQEQAILNEAFHLLKKYDLASPEQRSERNEKILRLLADE